MEPYGKTLRELNPKPRETFVCTQGYGGWFTAGRIYQLDAHGTLTDDENDRWYDDEWPSSSKFIRVEEPRDPFNYETLPLSALVSLYDLKVNDTVVCVKPSPVSKDSFTVGEIYRLFLAGSGNQLKVRADSGLEISAASINLSTFRLTYETMCRVIGEVEPKSVKSDGGFTAYYAIPGHATELRHLISHKGMSKSRGDIFKACYRLGEKEGTDVLYDLNKMKFFVEDLIEMHARGERL